MKAGASTCSAEPTHCIRLGGADGQPRIVFQFGEVGEEARVDVTTEIFSKRVLVKVPIVVVHHGNSALPNNEVMSMFASGSNWAYGRWNSLLLCAPTTSYVSLGTSRRPTHTNHRHWSPVGHSCWLKAKQPILRRTRPHRRLRNRRCTPSVREWSGVFRISGTSTSAVGS